MTVKKSKISVSKKKDENNTVAATTTTTTSSNKPKGEESPSLQTSTPALMTRSRAASKPPASSISTSSAKVGKRSTSVSKVSKRPATRRNSIANDEDLEDEHEEDEEVVLDESEDEETPVSSKRKSTTTTTTTNNDNNNKTPVNSKLNNSKNNISSSSSSSSEAEEDEVESKEVFSNVELNSGDEYFKNNSDSSTIEDDKKNSKRSTSRNRIGTSSQQTTATTTSSSRRKNASKKVEDPETEEEKSSEEESDQEESPKRKINSTTAKKPASRRSSSSLTSKSTPNINSSNGKRKRAPLVSNTAFNSDSESDRSGQESDVENSGSEDEEDEEKPVSKIRTRGSSNLSSTSTISKPSAKKKASSTTSTSPSSTKSKGSKASTGKGGGRKKQQQQSSSEESEEEGDNYESEEESEESEQMVESDAADESDVSMEETDEDLIELQDEEDLKVQKVLVTKLFKKKFINLPYLLSDYIKLNHSQNNSNNNITPPNTKSGTNTPEVKDEKKEDQEIKKEDEATNEMKEDQEMKDVSENQQLDNNSTAEAAPTTTTSSVTETKDSNALTTTDNKDTEMKEEKVDIQKMDVDIEKSTTTPPSATKDELSTTPVKEEEIRFLVLFKNKSYRCARWVTEKTIEKERDNPTLVKLLKTLKNQPPSPINDESEADPFYYFPKDRIQIDKILTRREVKATKNKKGSIFYLVKWKGEPHEKSTWEPADSLTSEEDQEAIKKYNQDLAIAEQGKKYVSRPTKLPIFNKELVPKFKGDLALKDFQVEGFLWLTFCWYQGRSSLLADEMGLGKTIQSIAFIQYLSQKVGIKGPFLIVAPLSTLGNWHKEFLKWTDMKTLVFYGSQETRSFISKYEFKSGKNNYLFEVLLTTYETIMSDHSVFVRVPWRALVLDEGHRIKNDKSKVLTKLKSIKTEHSVILTGTPLQNDMKELWTMLNFLDSEKFNDCNNFLSEYSDLKEESQVSKLHQLLSPYLLRRMKENVELSIPIKEETVIQVELSSTQKTYYRAILERNREFLARGIKHKSNLPKLSNIMIQIRKVCNHPFLIPGAEESIVKQEKITGEDELGELLVRSSSKLVLVDKLLQRLKAEGHQVLIFSQMVESLNILEDYLQYREYTYERLDGSIKSEVRQASIDRFQDKSANRFVFLLSTRAGGVGINLTTADTVILFDSDWNPQSDLQAQARCHRIGQTNNVKVYRLITRNTYEEYLFECATKKLLLDHIVLSTNKKGAAGKGSETAEQGLEITAANPFKVQENIDDPNSPSQISQMLKYGAAYLFAETTNEANEQDKIMINEDIDKILERSTTISFDSKNSSSKPSNLSGFSKATFASSETDMNVDMNDENFWEKVLPDYKTVKQLEEKLANGTALSTEETRASFVQDILDLAQSKKDDHTDSVSIEFIGDLVKLIMRVEFNTKFTIEEREKLQQTKLLLEKPRTRKRVIPEVIQTHLQDKSSNKKKSNSNNLLLPDSSDSSDGGGSDTDFVLPDDGDSYESDDHVETLDSHNSLRETKKREKKALSKSLSTVGGASALNGVSPQSLLAASWNKSQKDKFKQTLLKVGYHRWNKIQKELVQQGINKSSAEVQSVSESFLEIGLKQQGSVIKDFYDILLDDTSTYNYHRMGFDTENKIIFNTDSTPSNIKRYEVKKSFNSNGLFCGQTINVKFNVLDLNQQNQNTATGNNTTTSTSTTNNTTPAVKSENDKEDKSKFKVDENKEKVDSEGNKKQEENIQPSSSSSEKTTIEDKSNDQDKTKSTIEEQSQHKPTVEDKKVSDDKVEDKVEDKVQDKVEDKTQDKSENNVEGKSVMVEKEDNTPTKTTSEDKTSPTNNTEDKVQDKPSEIKVEDKVEEKVQDKSPTVEKEVEKSNQNIPSESKVEEKAQEKMDIDSKEDNNNKSNVPSTSSTSTTLMAPPLSMKNPSKISGFYLIITLDDFQNSQIVRTYSLGEAESGSVDVVLPGFANSYEFRIMFANQSTNTFRFVSDPLKFSIVSNTIWHPSDFPSFSTRIQTVLTRLIQLRAIKQLVTKYGKDLTELHIPYISRGPIPTWTSEDDKNLLVGVYKHGYGKYTEIFSDPELNLMVNVKKAQLQTFTSPPDPSNSGSAGANNYNNNNAAGSGDMDDLDNPSIASPSGNTPVLTEKIPSAESLRRRIQKVTDQILKKEHNDKLLRQHLAQQKQIHLQQMQREKEQKEREQREREHRDQKKDRHHHHHSGGSSSSSGSNTGNNYQSAKSKYSNYYEDNYQPVHYRKPEYSAGDLSSDEEDDEFKLKKMKLSHGNNNNSFFNKSNNSGSFFDKSQTSQQQLPPLGKIIPKQSSSSSSKSSSQQQSPLSSPNQYQSSSSSKSSMLSNNNINNVQQSPSKNSNKNYQNFSIRLLWENRIHPITIPAFTTLDSLKRLFIAKACIVQMVGNTGEDQNHILRFYYNDQLIPNGCKLIDFGIKDNDRISVFWESKWKTIQVKGFDYESVLMNVQDDTLLEDIVKAYFINSQPPYDIKNLRIEYNNQTLSLNTDVGTNKIKNESYLYIIPSQDIIRVFVTPSWGAEKETYALHRQTTMLSKLMDSFLKKHQLLPKQIDFFIPRLSTSLKGDKTPAQSMIENETEITAVLLLVRVDAVYNGTTVPYFLSTTTSFESLFQRFCEKLNIERRTTVFSYDGKRLLPDETPEGIHMDPHVTIEVTTNQSIQSPSHRFNQSVQPPQSPQRQQQNQSPQPQQSAPQPQRPSQSSSSTNKQHRNQQQQQQPPVSPLRNNNYQQQQQQQQQSQQPSIIEVEVKLVGQDAGSFIKMHTLNPFPLHILMEKFCMEHSLVRARTLFTYKGQQLNPNATLVDINLKDKDIIECHMI